MRFYSWLVASTVCWACGHVHRGEILDRRCDRCRRKFSDTANEPLYSGSYMVEQSPGIVMRTALRLMDRDKQREGI